MPLIFTVLILLQKYFENRFTYEKIMLSMNFIGISFVWIKHHIVNHPHFVVNPLHNLKHNPYRNLIPVLFK